MQPRHTELNSLHYLSIPEEISELEVEQAPVVQTMDSDVHGKVIIQRSSSRVVQLIALSTFCKTGALTLTCKLENHPFDMNVFTKWQPRTLC